MQRQMKVVLLSLAAGLMVSACSTTNSVRSGAAHQVDVHKVSSTGVGEKIGSIKFVDTANGLAIHTKLSQLPVGQRGFHIHENGSCEPAMQDGKAVAALAAGSHFNPEKSPHGTPLSGHLGDLPALTVDAQGRAEQTLYAPRLSLHDIKGRSVMIHAGGDNYADHPAPLGGGGARIACGVI